MAVLADSGFPNLANVTKRLDPDGSIAKIGELLDQDLAWLEDVPLVEGNLPTGHQITDRTALPSTAAVWRGYNQGGPTLKSDTEQFTEVCGLMEAYSKIDEKLAELNGNSLEWRASEANSFVEAFNQQFATSLFYESVLANPLRIHGLVPRYATTIANPNPTVTAPNNFLVGTPQPGSVVCHSVWLASWEKDKVFGIYPKGSKAGLVQKDLGLLLQTDAAGRNYEAYCEKFQWHFGLAIRDWRYVSRFLWDAGAGGGVLATGTNFLQAMDTQLLTIRKVLPSTRWYMDRVSMDMFTAQLRNSANDGLEWKNISGHPIPFYRGIPIRMVDTLVPELVTSLV